MKNISLLNIAQSAITSLTDIKPLNKGLWNLATAFPWRHRSLGSVLENLAAKTPEATALLFEEKAWTYSSLNKMVNRYAQALLKEGVTKGDAVAVFVDNRPETLVCAAAIAKIGAIAAMINTSQRDAVLRHSLGLVKPKIIIAGDELQEHINAEVRQCLASQTRYFWLPNKPAVCPDGWENFDTLVVGQTDANPLTTQSIQLRDPLFYVFTSGTTGLPKASIMSHYRWLSAAAGMGSMGMRLRADDVLYCPLPLYHNNALTVSWGSVLGAGATLALGKKFSASGFWDEIRHYDATAFCYIGELCRYLLNQPPKASDTQHNVKRIIGNGLRADLWEEFKTRFNIERIAEFYGASEGNIGFINAFNMDQTAGFCPYAFAVVKYDVDEDKPVLDASGKMIKVPVGESGLLLGKITAKTPYDGYTDAEASEKKLFRNVFKKNDAWFNTGDLVLNQGFNHIAFVDRVGDTFRWKGENVATTEVEAAFNQFDFIEQAVVYGVEIPNCDGRAGMAAITGIAADRVEWDELAKGLQASLPSYAVPLFIRVKNQQELTGTFKYKKSDLKRQGYRPNDEQEPVYLLQNNTFIPVTNEEIAALEQGSLKL